MTLGKMTDADNVIDQ